MTTLLWRLKEFSSMDLARRYLRAKDGVSIYLVVTSRFAFHAIPTSSTNTEASRTSFLKTGISSVPVGKSYLCVIDLRLKEDSLHSPLHTWAFSMK